MKIEIKTPTGIKKIGPGEPCFIIAEMSGNHHQNYDKAVEIVKAAAAAGADAIKIQTYTPDTMTIDSDQPHFIVKGKNNPADWKGQKLYDLYQVAYTPWEWDAPLQKLAHELGLLFFSTPFDVSSVDFLEKLNVPLYKISSYEATDFTLLRRIAETGKPVIISVGFCNKDDIKFALETLRKYGAKEILVLFCVTSYTDQPKLDEINLATMQDIGKEFGVMVGFSDNNGGIEIPALAAALGAVAIEKHVMIDRDEGGPDASFSLNSCEFARLVRRIREQEQILGKVNYGTQGQSEAENAFFRRSLIFVKDLAAGEAITKDNMRAIRPAVGLPTRYYDEIIGKKVKSAVTRGTPVSLDKICP